MEARKIPTIVYLYKNVDSVRNNYRMDSAKKKIELYYSIYKNYPHSVFASTAFGMFFHYYWEVNNAIDSNIFNEADNFIRNNPNNYYVNEILADMCTVLKIEKMKKK